MQKNFNGFFTHSSPIHNGAMQSTLKLLLIVICCMAGGVQSSGMEYSVKLSNCYDYKHGFDEQPDGSVPVGAVQESGSYKGGYNRKMQVDDGNNNNNNNSYNVNSGRSLTVNDTLTTQATAVATSVSGWKCCCWNAINQDEVECRCEGEALTRVPQTLTVPMQRLTIASAGLPRVRRTGLNVYAGSLLDIVLTDLKYLECIEDGAFASLKLLRTIYISHAPMLTFLSKDVFLDISSSIKIIRIINSGLMRVPDLMHLPTENILQMIDLDNNHITRIDKNSIRIKTDQLILANNDISYIDDSAFFGSQIAKLTLKENRQLREIHPNAFNGMSMMQELDLSSTSLVSLPSAGLQDIEELHIENTHTLKTIPSIYNFENLQRAYLTHSFHCCAFKFPSRHDPRRHAERMKEIAEWQQQCTKPAQQTKITDAAAAAAVTMAEALDQRKLMQKRMNKQLGGGGKGKGSERKESAESKQARLQSKLNLAEIPANGAGVIYSRLARAHLGLSSDGSGNINDIENKADYGNEWHDANYDGSNAAFDDADDDDDGVVTDDMVDLLAGFESDYLSDSMIKEIGIFHDEITINPDETQLDEFCGNFTFRKHDVECYPMPNALNPCEDVMGYQWLRISVWVVQSLAVIGNTAVLVVILSIRSDSSSVPRFLMCHLAFADLCLGLYLLLIASIDAHSMGEYFNYAYDWQYGAGCKVAGFLTVFASHLSVFTLTVITIERWMAITRAMYLNKRIKLRQAAFIMVGGWIFSITMSSFPLFGISNYSSTSICLPMENRDLFDTFYLVCLLGLNGVAFCIIAVCYAQIYLSLGQETRSSRSSQPGEMSVARKMALLVFTNFSCWAPIAFFGITALAGYPLINVTKSKILLVFFYPLNSCADPYLYAILTSQYRQDLYTLMGKLGICKQKVIRYKRSVSLPVTTHFSSSQRKSSTTSKQQSIMAETHSMLKDREDFV